MSEKFPRTFDDFEDDFEDGASFERTEYYQHHDYESLAQIFVEMRKGNISSSEKTKELDLFLKNAPDAQKDILMEYVDRMLMCYDFFNDDTDPERIELILRKINTDSELREYIAEQGFDEVLAHYHDWSETLLLAGTLPEDMVSLKDVTPQKREIRYFVDRILEDQARIKRRFQEYLLEKEKWPFNDAWDKAEPQVDFLKNTYQYIHGDMANERIEEVFMDGILEDSRLRRIFSFVQEAYKDSVEK
jgi:hypothetical protein